MPGFKEISVATTVLTLTLSILLAFGPGIVFWLFSVDGNEPAFFISRRAAVIFLGISVSSWFGRNAQQSELRQAVCLGMAIMMGGLALLGLGELMRGYAGPGILLAVSAETTFAFFYWSLWRRNS